MYWLGLEGDRFVFIAQPRHGPGTARVEAAPFRRVHQARRLTWRNFLKRIRVARIGIGCGSQQGVGVRVQGIFKQTARVRFFDQVGFGIIEPTGFLVLAAFA